MVENGKQKSLKQSISTMFKKENVVLGILLVSLVAGFAVMTGGALISIDGVNTVLTQSSIRGLAAIGQAFVVLTGNIDLSLYGIGILATLIGATTMTSKLHLNILGRVLPAYIGGPLILVVGLGMGAINGLLVSRVAIPSLIATLGMWWLSYGLAHHIGGGYTHTLFPPSLALIGQTSIAGVRTPIIIFFVAIAVAYLVLHYTRFGRNVYAVGGNRVSAYLAGINVKLVEFMVFVISGFCAGVAALVLESRMMSAGIRNLRGLEIDSIAAVTVGGVSLFGGKGSIIGVLMGVLIIGVLDSSLSMLGASHEVINISKGAIIIGAVSADQYFRSRNKSKMGFAT